MIKLFKLIYINLLSTTNLQRIKMSREKNVRDPKETQIIIYALFYLFLGYLIYIILKDYLAGLGTLIPILSYIISFVVIFFINMINAKDTLISTEENEFLFSLPLTNSEIILSKMALLYVKNIIIVLVIMIPTYIFYNSIVEVSDISSLVFILATLLLPIIPMIISTIYTAIDTYYKNSDKRKKYLIIKIIIIVLFSFLMFILFGIFKSNNLNDIIFKTYFLNPFIYLYKMSLLKNNLIAIIGFIFLQPILLYLFSKYFSFNYNYIISNLRGVKILNNRKIEVKKPLNSLSSLIKKEILTIKNNKVYFNNGISKGILFTILFFVISIFVNKDTYKMDYNHLTTLLVILGLSAGINCTTINSMSLEGNNIFNYKTLPIKFYKVLLSKWLTNIILILPLIIINTIIAILFFKIKPIFILFIITIPLAQIMFVSLLGLVLDFQFINYKETDDNIIIKGRIINYIPYIANIILLFVYYFIVTINNIYYFASLYLGITVFFLLLVFGYLLINYKKLYINNL